MREAVLLLQGTELVVMETSRGALVRPVDLGHVADLSRARTAPELSGVLVIDTVGADLGFHGSIVALHASARLDRVFAITSASARRRSRVSSAARTHRDLGCPRRG